MQIRCALCESRPDVVREVLIDLWVELAASDGSDGLTAPVTSPALTQLEDLLREERWVDRHCRPVYDEARE